MRNQRAITVEEAITALEDRLIQDLPCPTCKCEFWSEEILEGRKYLRCAGTWANGMDCNRLQPVPVLKDPPPVANLEGEADLLLASSARTVDSGSGSADYETARAAMLRDSDAVARLRGTEAQRNHVVDTARGLQAQAHARNAFRAQPLPELSLESWVAFVRKSGR